MAWDARKQMVYGLELETTMEEIEPLRAIDIHGGTEHSLGKRFLRTEISRTHGKVRERYLHMEDSRDRMADHDEDNAILGGRDDAV